MNRIRQRGNKFQVLITPYKVGRDGIEEMFGHWTDDQLRNYSIKEFSTMNDALAESYDYPDLNWERMVALHKDLYVDIYRRIKNDLDMNCFIYDLEPKAATGEQLKDAMFDRVDNFGERFTLTDNFNDVISYHIMNPWTKNLKEIAKVLQKNKRLRINRIEEEHGIIKLIGSTDLSSNYEIVLWPTLIGHWAKWVTKHEEVPDKNKGIALKDILKTQQQIDSTVGLR